MDDALSDALLDFLVPANLASRYRARITGVSALEAELRLPFRPALFRKGPERTCAAEMTLVVHQHVVRVKGTFCAEDPDAPTFARFRFSHPLSPRDLEILESATA